MGNSQRFCELLMKVNLPVVEQLSLEMEEIHISEFKEWLNTYLLNHKKPDTNSDVHMQKIFARLQEITLWDVEIEIDSYFSYKILEYYCDDVQSFTIPIARQWKSVIQKIYLSKIKLDPTGLTLDPYYNAQEIQLAPGLFLGSRLAAQDYFFLKAKKITHILTAAVRFPPLYPQEFRYKLIEVWDSESISLMNYFEAAIKWIDNALQNGKVLVHCHAGVSRSTTFVCAYLIKKYNLSAEEALREVNRSRPYATPNPGFRLQLQHFCKRIRPQVGEERS